MLRALVEFQFLTRTYVKIREFYAISAHIRTYFRAYFLMIEEFSPLFTHPHGQETVLWGRGRMRGGWLMGEGGGGR